MIILLTTEESLSKLWDFGDGQRGLSLLQKSMGSQKELDTPEPLNCLTTKENFKSHPLLAEM